MEVKFKSVMANGYDKSSVKIWINELNEVLEKAKAASQSLELAKIYSFIGQYKSNLSITSFGGYNKDEVDRYVADLITKINNTQTQIKNLLESNGLNTSFSQKTLESSFSGNAASSNSTKLVVTLFTLGTVIIVGGIVTYIKIIHPSGDNNTESVSFSSNFAADEETKDSMVKNESNETAVTTASTTTKTTTTTAPTETTTTTTTTTAPPEPKKTFKAYAEACTWSEARNKCESMGGHLAYVTSDKEYDDIMKALSGTGLKFVCSAELQT